MSETYQGDRRAAFTLVEMLISMAVTLLLMAALGRGFAFVGEAIRDSRTQVELTNELRDVSNRIQDELSRCTVPLRPCTGNDEPAGYFVYYEGPVTDATSSLFGAVSTGDIITPHSRYGDFDDYLAFTAVASGDNWFTGKVPRFVLDQKTAELAGATYDPANFPGNAWDPVVIRSKYAEIAYFASPEYAPGTLPASPAYLDVEGNLLPSNLRLHRRVLLIRPDLNLSGGGIEPRAYGGVNYLLADEWPTIVTPGSTVTPAAIPGDAWLYGMAGVHQQCDLSLRRVLNADGTPSTNVAANSLQDLAQPHNRFAHVRVPGNLLGIGNQVTSMPVLALSSSATILNAISEADGARIAPPALGTGTGTAAVVTPQRWSGFIRPEFVLGYDGNHPSNPTHHWGTQRIGEDVLATNALAFDVKVYDRTAPVITTSQGQVVDSSSPGFREALREVVAGTHDSIVTGDFVDLMYPVLAGGSMRGWDPRRFDRLTPAAQQDGTLAPPAVLSQFSGLVQFGTSLTAYQPGLYKSGKIITDNSGQLRLFQPTFDTFTSQYERDGLRQVPSGTGWTGTRWQIGLPGAGESFDSAADGLHHGTAAYGSDNFYERETAPPFIATPRALQVSIRLENPLNRQVRQMTVVHQSVR